MNRQCIDSNMLEVCSVIAKRTTCCRRQVGCVITDEQGNILSTGFNGVARGQTHCIDTPCIGANSASGTNLNSCEAIHAEQNALVKLMQNTAHTLYCSTEPCVSCTKLILASSIKRVVYSEPYANSGKHLFIGEWTHEQHL